MIIKLIVSLSLVSLCVVIHALGLVLLADWLFGHPQKLQAFSRLRSTQLLTLVFAIITLLHLGETLIWATFYDLWGLFDSFETSWYFSVGTYTTIGYGDVLLPAKWRMLGGVEGISGVLLCGLSGAFLFSIVNQMFKSRLREQSPRSGLAP